MLTLLLTMTLSVCGDGRIDTSSQQQCAPCMAGNRCPCGEVQVPTEPCDGKNLGGKRCEGLGFLGGTLACTATCELDTSGCTRPSGPSREVTPGAFGDVATSGDRVAVVTSSRSMLTFETFTWPDLTPGVKSQLGLRVKADGAGGVGELKVARAGAGWVVAGQVYGSSGPSLWHLSPEGQWTPRGVAAGQRPLFLVNAGQELALGSESWAADSKSVGVTVTTLSPDGTPGASRFLPAPDRRLTGNSASAAFFGGALHVLSVCNPNQPNSPVRLDGEPLDLFGGSGALAAEGNDGALALIVNDALWRLSLDGKGRLRAAPKRALPASLGPIASAAVVNGALLAWVRRGAVLTRVTVAADGAVKREDLVSGVGLEVLSVRQSPEGALTLTSAEGGTTLRRF